MLVFILITLLVAIIAICIFVFSYTGYQLGWYYSLEKPDYYYYTWIYSPIWFLIYAIVIFTWVRLMNTRLLYAGVTLLYLLQLVLLFLFTLTFYYYRNIEQALYILIATILLLMAIMVVSVVDPVSLILLTVYLIWLLYILYITWRMAILNPISG